MTRLMAFSASLWLTTFLCAAVGAHQVDALVALGSERFTLPLYAGLLALVPLLLWHPLVYGLARKWPRTAMLHLLVPLVMSGFTVVTLGLAPKLGPAEVVAASGEHEDIVLITLDTYRADHMGALGGKVATPELDALAAAGTLFTQAVTTAPLTAPSHASMLTGLEVREHGLLRNGGTLQAPTVVGQLRQAGYHTGAFLSAAVLSRKTGLSREFHHYDDELSFETRLRSAPWIAALVESTRAKQRPGDVTLQRALEWWNETPSPRFLWVHFYDAHAPYSPTGEWKPPEDERRAARDLDREKRRSKAGDERLRHGNPFRGMPAGDASARLHEFKLLYAAETRYVDHLVGQVVKAVPERATIIVTADHGESLDEHGYFFNHGATLWEESMHVPLVVRGPGFAAGQRVEALTGVIDVAPTLLGVAGLAPASQGLRGLVDGTRSLKSVVAYTTGQEARGDGPLMRAGKRRERGQRDADGNKLLGGEKKQQLAAVRLAGKKLIGGPRQEPSFYDLVADPGEATPLPVPEELSKEKERLQDILSRPINRPSDEELEQLHALGYVE